ncbi:MAG: F0F1 ATP synthase subunit B [Phycisphaerales bacterium]|nr:MAG: F0F1 ATP synthase subunit B [Phycisphaerales bacterium]
MLYLLVAEGGSPVDPKIVPAITSIVVFLVFFGVVRALVWPKITKGLDEREAKILHEIEAAEEAREKARSAQADYERSLDEARENAREMISKARSDAKVTADEMLARNEVELTRMKQRATQDIENAKQAAVGHLHDEAANLAAAIAGKILQREISVEDQQRLVEESLRELGKIHDN